MKKRICALLMIIAVTAVSLTGCGAQAAATGSPAAAADDDVVPARDQDLVFMGGLYISDPENDLMLALYRRDGDPVAVITKLGNVYQGEFVTEETKTADGHEYTKITVDGKDFGYFFDEGYLEDSTIGGLLIDEDGTVYDAKPLDESVAMEDMSKNLK